MSSTSRSSHTPAASGRVCWSPGSACWTAASGIRWWGANLLIGALWGSSFALVIALAEWIPEVAGVRGQGFEAGLWSWESLRGLRHAAAAVSGVHTESLLAMFIGIMMFLVLRLLLRRTWIAVTVFTVLMLVVFNPATGHPRFPTWLPSWS